MKFLGHFTKVLLAVAMLVAAGPARAQTFDGQTLGGMVSSSPAAVLHVEGKGTISAVAGTCPTLTLTISGIPVTVNESTVFAGGQSCAQLAATQLVEVRGDLTITGATLSVVATTIEIEDGSERAGEGRVTGVTGTCPNITIAVDGLSIQADSLTRYLPANRGAGCDQIRLGTKISASTVALPGGGVRARLIEVKGQRHFGEGEGRITSVSGSCPDLRIFFGDTPVDVNATTDFVGGTCRDLAVGVRVQARGFRDDDSTTNIASWIKFKGRHVEGRSVITAVSGSCPALSFTVGGVVLVVTDASTVFVGGACATLRVGVRVYVSGDMRTEDGAVIAERVTIEEHPEGRPGGRVEGAIGTVTGSCPAKTLTVRGVQVTTSEATRYEGITCATLVVGARIEVEGPVQNGVLVAVKIERED